MRAASARGVEMEWLVGLVERGPFMPHGHCIQWRADLLWLLVGSDALIVAAYTAIPLLLVHFARRRSDLPFAPVFWLFGTFIVLCGITHALAILTTWYPLYWVEGWAKLATGVVSIATAAALVPILPQALQLRSPRELEALNRQLAGANEQLQEANAELERVNRDLRAARAAEVEAATLRRVNEELEILAASVSHDLRAPLRGMTRAAAWLEEDLGEGLAEEHLELLCLLRERSEHLDAMLVDLLRYYRAGVEAGDPEPVDLHALLDDLAELQDLPAGLELHMQSLTDRVRVPRVPLMLVLRNLVSNALQHHGGRRGQVRVELEQRGDVLHICVEDDGQGIAPRHQERIFDLFQQGEGGGSAGTGMGLALVRRVLGRKGAHIDLVSNPGEGTRFLIRWPLRSGSASAD